MKILKHPIFAPCTCDKCMTVFQVDTNDELETVFYDGVIQAWKIDCPVCRHRCNLEWAGIINPSDVTDTNVDHKSEWISVQERVPDCEQGAESEAVLFITKQGFMYTGYYGCGGIYHDRYFREYKNSTEGYDISSVTHWMPLPELPKGD